MTTRRGETVIERVDEIGGYVTLQRACELSGYCEKQMRHLALHGRLRAKRLGRLSLLIEKRSLEEYGRRAKEFAGMGIPRGPASVRTRRAS